MSRNMKNKPEGDRVDSISSFNGSKSQYLVNVFEKTSNSDSSIGVIRSLLVDWKQRGFDREMRQDPNRDR